jgi:hypothetical protein
MFLDDIDPKSPHFSGLAAPGILGLALFTMTAPGFPWWFGLALYPVVLLTYGHLHNLAFPPGKSKKGAKAVLLASALVLFQIAFWFAVFAYAQDRYLRGLNNG